MSDTFEQFKEYLEKMNKYNQVLNLVFWDIETIMPKNGFQRHSDALTYFSTEHFKLTTSDELRGYLEKLNQQEEYDKLDDDWKFIVKKMKKECDEASRIPEEFYSEYVQK